MYPARSAYAVDLAASQRADVSPLVYELDSKQSRHSRSDGDSRSDGNISVLTPAEQEVKTVQPKVTQFSSGLHTRNMSTDCLDMLDDDSDDDSTAVREGKVTEFDLAAYAKEDLTLSMQKKIMRRMFCAFDLLQTGYLDVEKLKEFCSYVGSTLSEAMLDKMYSDLQSMDGKITFERFWDWWKQHPDKDMTEKTFSFVSADFSVPYHQQQLKIKQKGEIFTPSYRICYYFKDLETGYQRQISPWHDVPLQVRDPVRTKPENVPANRYNFICEIPKWTRAKFEIATGEPFNPIKQDIKNGIPRFYKHGDMMWNYGAFPQTWESTEVTFEAAGVCGDNDPVDGIEIGMRQFLLGEIHPVKILGVLGMIDDGQMDWKFICMSMYDPIVQFIRDIDDVPRFLPGCLDAVREWLRVYKICQGGVENKFAFDGEFKDKTFAMKILEESHLMWENLRKIKKRNEV